MTFNYRHLFVLFMMAALATLLFIGQFHNHHGDRALFMKRRPTFKQMFHPSPEPMTHAADYGAEEKRKDTEYEEFVLENKLKESEGIIVIPYLLIQICISLLVTGFFAFLRQAVVSIFLLIQHFMFNILLTILGLFFLLWADSMIATVTWFPVLIVVNVLTIVYFIRMENRLPQSSN